MSRVRDLLWSLTLLAVWRGPQTYASVFGPRPGLNVGTRRFQHDVVKDGIASPHWTNVSSSDHGKSFAPGVVGFSLYLSLNHSELRDSEPYQHYKVTLNNLSPMVFFLEVPPDRDMDATVKTTDYGGKELHFQFRCLKEGWAYAILQFELDTPQFFPLALHIQHECKLPTLNVAVPVSFGYPNVIQAGKLLPTFHYLAGVNEAQTGFALWLPAGDAVGAQYYTVGLEYDSSLMVPTVSTDGRPARPLAAGSVAQLHIRYGCNHDIRQPTNTQLNISLEVGWKEAIRFEYTKTCGVAAGNGSGGWSPAGVVFFVLFIILLVAFIGGTAFNYIKLNKRGWDVLPGARCLRLCRGQEDSSEYVPQANYDADAYQTNL